MNTASHNLNIILVSFSSCRLIWHKLPKHCPTCDCPTCDCPTCDCPTCDYEFPVTMVGPGYVNSSLHPVVHLLIPDLLPKRCKYLVALFNGHLDRPKDVRPQIHSTTRHIRVNKTHSIYLNFTVILVRTYCEIACPGTIHVIPKFSAWTLSGRQHWWGQYSRTSLILPTSLDINVLSYKWKYQSQ